MSRRHNERASRQTPALVRGFTLIEMMVVLAIIGTLALLVGPALFRNLGDAKVIAAQTQIETLSLALDTYHLDIGTYPSTAQGLAALRERPLDAETARKWRGPYLRKNVPADPWGRPYRYSSPGIVNPESFDLLSLGRNGVEGGAGEDGDITSWGGDTRP